MGGCLRCVGCLVMVLVLLSLVLGPSVHASSTNSSAPTAVVDDDDGEPTVTKEEIECHDETIIQWTKEQLQKQPNSKTLKMIAENKRKTFPEKGMETEIAKSSLEGLGEEGFLSSAQVKKIIGGEKFENFYLAPIEGKTLLVGVRGFGGNGLTMVYIKEGNSIRKLLRLNYPLDEV